ncbi:M20/M25/M40 family metallo-hydrolase [Agreia sp. COWG]|uniref:M20/M25/M40 family metallo-hydrolase n=1 Tax=Agreia sp. COWG TaxID=2773266 RepID=UPI001928FCE6|nr:M20/M25/M40 family metallo-hydrolase [Agreia sp. COWG]CAD6002564.1 Acetylornithine deacetylase/Succinyl-diaminopimelate desuccinylase [Agreia sp. COWG]
MTDSAPLGDQAIALLRDLIRSACVNDGTDESGQEIRNAGVLRRFFADVDVEPVVVESAPGRATFVVRIPGTDPEAPSLALVGHLDVVPVMHAGWSEDPFAADIVRGQIFGRGALDMLYLTAAYAVATRAVVAEGRALRGDLVFVGVADEEGGSRLGIEWLMQHHPELIDADYVLTESGGVPVGGTVGAPTAVTVTVGEKGLARRRLLIRGIPGHGSAPWGSSNAGVIAAEAITRLTRFAPRAVIGDYWPRYVDALGLDADVARRLTSEAEMLGALNSLGELAGYAHATTHTTISPNVIRAGDAINVIPGQASIDLDIRQLPGVSAEAVDAYVIGALGDLIEHVDIVDIVGASFSPANVSPMNTPLFEVLADVIDEAYPGAVPLPIIAAGGSDARFYRKRGRQAYGFSVLSRSWDYGRFRHLIHGNDEHIDLDSVRMTARALDSVVRRFLG